MRTLDFHKRSVHEGLRFEKPDLDFHKKTIHEGQKGSYKCDPCDKTFSYSRSLQVHKRSVHEGLRFECTVCKKTFNQKANLYQHLKTVHEGQKLLRPCKFCKKVFKQIFGVGIILHCPRILYHKQNIQTF